MKRCLFLALIAMGVLIPASAQTTVFNCGSWANTGTCGANTSYIGQTFGFNGNGPPTVSGTRILLMPTGATHQADNLQYNAAKVNDQAFTSTFTFVPNGWNLAFVLQNNTNSNSAGLGIYFGAGAGCEASFYQAFSGVPPNNIFALELDSQSYIDSSETFPYSTVQIYHQDQSPCNPNDNQPNYTLTDKISTYPVPLTSPANNLGSTTGDTYSATISYDGTNVVLNLYDITAGGSCPGSKCFTYTWTDVNIPSLVNGTTAYVGLSTATNETSVYPLYINSFSYTEGSTTQAGTPTFSPAAGTYTGAQSVTLSTASSGAVICYNTTGSPATNGSTGCANGTLYTGPVAVSSSETLYAVAGETGYADSPVGSAGYAIQSTVSTPVFSPVAGSYSSAQSVTISDATSGATVYYTTNGTAPTTSSIKYTGPITVSSTEKLEAIAVATGGTNSAVASAAYTITSLPTVATPTFSPAAGTYNSAQSVGISDATAGATIYYTTNGTTPTTSSTQYTGPITVSSTETLQAIAVAPGDTNSAVASAAYTINLTLPSVSTPTFSPAGGTYSSAQPVTISDPTSDATIYYTTNGATPTPSSTEYTGPITVSSTETLQAIAVATGDANSALAAAAYTITPSLSSVATPTFSPAAGAYTSAQSVSISDATGGATIYYTTNGTTPTTFSTQYAGPITVSSTETLQAIAIATGDTNSAVASAAYTISSSLPSVSTPTFSPAAGTYTSAQSVSISDTASGATIYYTTNGTTPTTSSTQYAGPITVSSTETLQAIAVATGDSAVASAAYTISSQPNFVLGTSSPSLTVNSGGQGTLTVTVTPVNGFDSPVVLACSGLPTGATCSFDQATVTPSGGAATTQLTISTSPQSSRVLPGSRPLLPLTALAMTVCLFGWRKRRGFHHWLLLAVAYAGLGLLFGCGVSGITSAAGTSTTPNPTSNTSMVTLTAISGTLQGKATIVLTVN
jgi:hypothetical protein